MKFAIFALVLALSGCGSLNEMVNDLNDTADELIGEYTAPTLAGSPRPSRCSDQRCEILVAIQTKGYELARQKKITWGKLVDVFYQERAELYPNSQDGHGVNELRAYQRALAEQMDLGKITESHWAYLIEKKTGDINARNEALSNTARRNTNCTTTNVGTNAFPEYKTTCN